MQGRIESLLAGLSQAAQREGDGRHHGFLAVAVGLLAVPHGQQMHKRGAE